MPSIEDNKDRWDGSYPWNDRGDEWSRAWGGPAMQWYGCILPRISASVPAPTILEIACCYGRWTRFLKDLCQHLIVVDLSERCVDACRRRFSDCTHITYYVNDGSSLDMIADRSVDLVFSFDSLVHANDTVIKTYIGQLGRILKRGGAAFIHRSNLGQYRWYPILSRVRSLKNLLSVMGVMNKNFHWRDPSVGARNVASYAGEASLTCIAQKLITWGTGKALIDCLSTIVRKDSCPQGANRVLRNPYFMREAEYLSRLSKLYANHRKVCGP
jgi:SAM-dependent methyltransferase